MYAYLFPLLLEVNVKVQHVDTDLSDKIDARFPSLGNHENDSKKLKNVN
jgi:hypothetical protein